LQFRDAIALARIVRVDAERGRERTDHFIEELAGSRIFHVGEVEHLADLQVRGRHEVLHEQDRIDDLQRVRAARYRADLRVEEAVVPVDLGLRAEAVVGQLFQRNVKRRLLRAGLAAELEALPALRDERAHHAVAGENRFRVGVVRLPDVAARFGSEAGDRAVLQQEQPVTFGHDDLRAVRDDVGGAFRVRPASGVRALRHGGEKGRGARQTCGHRKEVLPLVGKHAADRTRHRLNQTHDVSRVRGRTGRPVRRNYTVTATNGGFRCPPR
jgi:hypothetical protein